MFARVAPLLSPESLKFEAHRSLEDKAELIQAENRHELPLYRNGHVVYPANTFAQCLAEVLKKGINMSLRKASGSSPDVSISHVNESFFVDCGTTTLLYQYGFRQLYTETGSACIWMQGLRESYDMTPALPRTKVIHGPSQIQSCAPAKL